MDFNFTRSGVSTISQSAMGLAWSRNFNIIKFLRCYRTARITDGKGNTPPPANNKLTFSLEDPGEILATDNGDPTNLVPFPSHERTVFNGFCLVIVRAQKGRSGKITLTAESESLETSTVTIQSS